MIKAFRGQQTEKTEFPTIQIIEDILSALEGLIKYNADIETIERCARTYQLSRDMGARNGLDVSTYDIKYNKVLEVWRSSQNID